ncbi:hypothetical protein CH337_19490 [Rhodoblastus acidophilus]|uniref:hypothetical protein n=1 Tax=Rhodoblastus acidophilus TaxID=1074 RepID=UPI000CECC2E8|nr:hypothetical protein [Rhodoblastus acidophilus]PPQ34978.1 hypothetical protein CKO16_21450 [Rhodoblastus acidophilus]RAI16822.1 hypothetical protein CH337_19490 [Rhodoblastus acidophilus]
MGKAKLVHPLHTDSLITANRLKWPILLRFNEMLENAEQTLRRKGREPDPITKEALEYPAELQRAEANPMAAAQYHSDGYMEVDGREFIQGMISDRSLELLELHGPQQASQFNGIALGTSTPLMMLVDEWLSAHTCARVERYTEKPVTTRHLSLKAGQPLGQVFSSQLRRCALMVWTGEGGETGQGINPPLLGGIKSSKPQEAGDRPQSGAEIFFPGATSKSKG